MADQYNFDDARNKRPATGGGGSSIVIVEEDGTKRAINLSFVVGKVKPGFDENIRVSPNMAIRKVE